MRVKLPGHYERADEVVECTPLGYVTAVSGRVGCEQDCDDVGREWWDMVTTEALPGRSVQRRDLAGTCLANMLHDGYTDQLYALLPIWQADFGLSYAGLGVVRVLYYGTMGALQVPGDKFIGRVSSRTVLAVGTFVAASGYLVMAMPGGLAVLCAGLVLGGIGSSTQHPRGSLLVAEAYGKGSRGALGIYNFAGDLGKATLPAVVALLLPILAWRLGRWLDGFSGDGGCGDFVFACAAPDGGCTGR